jgi:RNA polymerase sigma-70 factor (ECF subfamily)
MSPRQREKTTTTMTRAPTELSDPDSWLDRHGDALYRFALLRVRDRTLAEDLVQDTLLAALRARAGFSGQSAERTWLIAILKNKVVDHFRRTAREAPLPEADDPDEAIEALFAGQPDGHWARPPAAWQHPDRALEQAEFWKIFEDCLQALPARQAEAFTLTELDNHSTDELCKLLGVSTSNLWVLMHRARLRLRECLEQHWFGAGEENR